MDNDTQRTNQENLDFLAAPLEPSKREALELVCTELGLDREAFEQIEWEARELRDFETHGKARLKTPRQKIKTLQKVEELANALYEAMQEFDTADQLQLWIRLPIEKIFPSKFISDGDRCIDLGGIPFDSLKYGDRFGRVGHISLEVKDLAKAARDERLSLGAAGVKGGRKLTLGHYALHVAQIGLVAKDASMPVGRGGKFEALCVAVFKAADIHASPEGAIRELLAYRAVANSLELPD